MRTARVSIPLPKRKHKNSKKEIRRLMKVVHKLETILANLPAPDDPYYQELPY